MGIVLATGYRHESKPPGEERQSLMREGRASDRLGKKEVGLLSGHLGALLATHHSSLSCQSPIEASKR